MLMIRKAWSVAQRGRYTHEHKPGAPTKQRLELQHEQGISNAITTIQKDNRKKVVPALPEKGKTETGLHS